MLEIIKNWFSPVKKIIGFEDVKYAIKHSTQFHIINTLPPLEQECIIFGTIPVEKEELLINQLLDSGLNHTKIILYGKNSVDDSIILKHKQLNSLGFNNVYIYRAGLFEWLLLQDIYGTTEFPTTSSCKDILKYRVASIFYNNHNLITG
jgi:hypothetical protein